MKLLLAEDEISLAEQIREDLTAEGYEVDVAHDGSAALRLAGANTYHALLLDINLPQMDGLTVLRQLRRQGDNAPAIFLTAQGEIEDKVRGLDAGADDYLAKPFSMVELLARLRAVLRRERPESAHRVRVADLELDLVTHEARRAGQTIELTRREFALLELLVSASPKPVTKTAIVEHVWDQQHDTETNVVNVYINMLRRKIDQPGLVPLIHTVRGVGFVVREMTA